MRLSEFSSPKQYSRNSIPPVSYLEWVGLGLADVRLAEARKAAEKGGHGVGNPGRPSKGSLRRPSFRQSLGGSGSVGLRASRRSGASASVSKETTKREERHIYICIYRERQIEKERERPIERERERQREKERERERDR